MERVHGTVYPDYSILKDSLAGRFTPISSYRLHRFIWHTNSNPSLYLPSRISLVYEFYSMYVQYQSSFWKSCAGPPLSAMTTGPSSKNSSLSYRPGPASWDRDRTRPFPDFPKKSSQHFPISQKAQCTSSQMAPLSGSQDLGAIHPSGIQTCSHPVPRANLDASTYQLTVGTGT